MLKKERVGYICATNLFLRLFGYCLARMHSLDISFKKYISIDIMIFILYKLYYPNTKHNPHRKPKKHFQKT